MTKYLLKAKLLIAYLSFFLDWANASWIENKDAPKVSIENLPNI